MVGRFFVRARRGKAEPVELVTLATNKRGTRRRLVVLTYVLSSDRRAAQQELHGFTMKLNEVWNERYPEVVRDKRRTR